METKDHLYLARLITDAADFKGKIKKNAFEYGCIYPDINPFTYIKGHTYAGTVSFVNNVLKLLYGKLRTPSDYFNLGQAVHYVGDYFTFPHNPIFKGTLSEHIGYEHSLHKHIFSLKNENIILEYDNDFSNSKKCISLIDKMYKKYCSAKKSVSSDWNYIRYMCSNIALTAVKATVSTKKLIPEKSFV